MKKLQIARRLIALVFASTAGVAMAQAYPAARPINFIVPFPAGSATDLMARVRCRIDEFCNSNSR